MAAVIGGGGCSTYAEAPAAFEATLLSDAERKMTVEEFLNAACAKRTRLLMQHMEQKVELFERAAKRARAQLEDAARAAAASRDDEEHAEGPQDEEMTEVFCLQGIKGPYAGETFWMPAAIFSAFSFSPARMAGTSSVSRVCLKASQVSLSSLNWGPRPAGAFIFARWALTALAVSLTSFCCSGVRLSR